MVELNAKPVASKERTEFIERRPKEILEEGGYRLDAFSENEKQIAVLQAAEEYDAKA